MFDTHCHLTDERFTGEVDDVLARARQAGVTGVVTIASDLDDARSAAELARLHADVWYTVGVHPHAAAQAAPGWAEELRLLARDPRVVAIGESGLDFYYDTAPRAVQKAVFEQQLQLSSEVDLPIVVHAREASADTAAMIRAARGVRGVLHCFAGDRALLDTALDEGWYVGFGGMITFKNFDGRDLLAAVPSDRLLLETDSPYLAPVPFRGKRNEPAYVAIVTRAAAVLRAEDPALLERQTDENARRFYGIDG